MPITIEESIFLAVLGFAISYVIRHHWRTGDHSGRCDKYDHFDPTT